MTYCVALKLDEGIAFCSDTRTNAGVDNIACFRKLYRWETPGERTIIMLAAGNLAVTQSVVSMLNEAIIHPEADQPQTMLEVSTMFQAARRVGEAVRDVRRIDGPALEAAKSAFSASFILGGQIKGEEPRLFNIYSEGNFIEATAETRYFQIGEHKYGKPILDRVTNADMPLNEAAKLILLSFDSTLRSNLSVGMPLDLLLYKANSFGGHIEKRIDENDAYFKSISQGWSKALRNAFAAIPAFDPDAP
jgi:putative proteasome-type protease